MNNHQLVVDSHGVSETSKPGARERDRILSLYREQGHNRLKAHYDAAQTTPENERHWAVVDYTSPNNDVLPEVRRKLRARSRYEAANNSFYAGALQTDADAALGPGPNIRFFFGDDDTDSAARELFRRWARRVHLAHKLRIARQAYLRDGEVVLLPFSDLTLPDDGPQINLHVIEADRLASPFLEYDLENNIDGVLLDRVGVPVRYQILKQHPDDSTPYIRHTTPKFEYDEYTASEVIHYFRDTRPGQYRGVPACVPCLNLFANFRRYKLAVVTAAETAANIAAMLKLDTALLNEMVSGNPDSSGLILPDDELFDIVRGSMPALPPGYTLEQLKAEQPTTTLDMFEKALIREIARSFGMTYPVMAGDSGDSNMSSGNIDERRWWQHLESERSHLDEVILDRVVDWWWSEQRLIPSTRSQNSLPALARVTEYPRRRTTWSTRFTHNDPAKVAAAEKTYHELGLLTDDRWLEMQNLDANEHYEEMQRQVERRKSLGLSPTGGELPQPEPDGNATDDSGSNARSEQPA